MGTGVQEDVTPDVFLRDEITVDDGEAVNSWQDNPLNNIRTESGCVDQADQGIFQQCLAVFAPPTGSQGMKNRLVSVDACKIKELLPNLAIVLPTFVGHFRGFRYRRRHFRLPASSLLFLRPAIQNLLNFAKKC